MYRCTKPIDDFSPSGEQIQHSTCAKDAEIAVLKDTLVAEQLAHAKHKELLRRVAFCSDVFVNFREDIWGDLRDFYRENV